MINLVFNFEFLLLEIEKNLNLDVWIKVFIKLINFV